MAGIAFLGVVCVLCWVVIYKTGDKPEAMFRLRLDVPMTEHDHSHLYVTNTTGADVIITSLISLDEGGKTNASIVPQSERVLLEKHAYVVFESNVPRQMPHSLVITFWAERVGWRAYLPATGSVLTATIGSGPQSEFEGPSIVIIKTSL